MRQDAIRKDIKQKIKNSVPQNEMFVFSLSAEEYRNLDWEKKDKEFHYENSMYDVVRKNTGENGTITLFCINDFRESRLFVNLEDQVQKNSSAEKNALKAFKLLADISFPGILITIILIEENPDFFSFKQPVFFSFTGKIPSPPPEFA